MKKTVILFALLLILIGGVIGALLASVHESDHKGMGIDECVELVKSLQTGNDEERRSVLEQLQSNPDWTLLDEIGDPSVDEQDQFMSLDLNALAYEAASSELEDYGNPQGVFVDGRDPDYKVCFIEKCLAPAQEVVYELSDRAGEESIAVVEMQEGDLDVWLEGEPLLPADRVFRGVCRSDNIKLRLRNRRGTMVSFVIINEH